MISNMLHNCLDQYRLLYKENKLLFVSRLGQLCTFFAAIVCLVIGMLMMNYAVMMFGTFFVWLASVFYCVANLRKRFLLIAFDVVIFVFLMCRPLLDILKGFTRWHYYAADSVWFAIVSVAVSVFCIYIGAILYERFFENRRTACSQPLCLTPKNLDTKMFRRLALIAYVFCAVFFLIRMMDALIFMQGRPYTDYYTEYESSYPSFVYTISVMMPYALCFYLATFPRKRPAFCALALYVVTAIPELLIGIRNPIVLNVIFAFLYYCIRDHWHDGQKWIGKMERYCMVIGIPAAMVLLSVMNYTRDGGKTGNHGVIAAIIDLFYKQGVSFDVLCMGHNAIPSLPGGEKCYTFGPFIENIVYGRIGQILFGTTALPTGNNAIRAINGYSFAHSMSYVAHPDYLNGSGWGTSYILETFADAGWFGIVAFSLLLGVFLIWFIPAMKGKWLTRAILLIALTQILFLPRAEAMGWWTFLIRIHFWFILIACVAGGWILEKMQSVPWFNKKKQ